MKFSTDSGLVSIADVENGVVYGPFINAEVAESAFGQMAAREGFGSEPDVEGIGRYGEGLFLLKHETMGELARVRAAQVEAEARMAEAAKDGTAEDVALALAYRSDEAALRMFVQWLMEAGYLARAAITTDDGEFAADELVETYMRTVGTY